MDRDGEERALVEKLSNAFEPYLKAPHELERIRDSIRSYMATLIEEISHEKSAEVTEREENGSGPLVDGLRGEYLKALRANLAARHQYDGIASQAESHLPNLSLQNSATSKQDLSGLLDQHVKLLRAQKQHATLVTLKDELEHIKRRRQAAVLDVRPTPEMASTQTNSDTDMTILADSIIRSVKALERAVVQAHRQENHEKTSLENTKLVASNMTNTTSQLRLHALSTTRRELAAWVEESLEMCQGENNEPDHVDMEDAEFNISDSEQKIDHQYNLYLEARQRLLSAVATLKAPLPETSSHGTLNEKEVNQLSTNTIFTSEGHDLLNKVEKDLLPASQQQRVLQGHLSFADEQLENEISDTINMLDRLRDESQLLQAFPILAQSRRFEHATSTFGKHYVSEVETHDQISKRIGPWLFAADAADIATTGTIATHVEHGKQAMDSVSRSLTVLQLLREVNMR
ncbi:uncharacterized protein Z518_06106 [Rhinocladiella mackenziei CBS 650.93]|uniref:Rhinocladiella mackenziei CBS 650.93 unplaced genomic scaffold supercont1.4, whole genome shotgun sequence n=1 Tax=Rhinocladiella mackenziei CBS 650.93 TaxID=1442369 RepID=A0A0D2IHG7_9EURO|nr:uncharacterized protein Z518_06106 [Rhinocladiella mackenziei CBS 650.93]KIX05234.1 hypothetical protein Z518_06106 [Rhinocladiella mackenziei CBS 650.93]